VMLGAGLDSFVWRYPDQGSLRVFEVDHPASQAWKRRRVMELGLPALANQVYVPVDFESSTLREGLDAAGFDWDEPTFFSWLGVTMYLTIDAIEETLRTVASCPAGSEIVFSYSLPLALREQEDRDLIARLGPILAGSGEPVQTQFAPNEVDHLVVRCGLRVADHPDRAELGRRYTSDRTDDFEPYGGECLITAAVT
jgi:methyltransferase (TIGR00027 family)